MLLTVAFLCVSATSRLAGGQTAIPDILAVRIEPTGILEMFKTHDVVALGEPWQVGPTDL